jgi:chromosome segregation ATPase
MSNSNIQNQNQTQNEENIDEFYDYLPADHPLMKNLQSALEVQLKSEEEQLRLQLKEKSEELRKVKRNREDIGVKLYNFQQRYAKLEEIFNEEYNKYMVLKSQLEETEKHLNDQVQKFQSKSNSIKEQEKMVNQASEELNQLNAMLKYVEQYNTEVNSQIEVTNRNAQVVEKKIVSNESEKKKQDFLIDSLEEKIKNLHEKKLLFEAQLKSQVEQTKEARMNLVEAEEEIKNIIDKKNSLYDNWNKAVISMKAKDKAMQAVMEDINITESDKVKFSSQINKYRELIQKEIFKYSELEHEINLIKLKQQSTDQLINDILIKKERQQQKQSFILQSIRKTIEDIKTQEQNESNLRSQIEVIDKNKLKLLEMTRNLNEQNLIVLSSKETHEKQTENMIKSNMKLEKDRFNLEVEIDLKLNEISRVEIDELNVETQNESIIKKIQLMNKEIENLEKDYKDHENKIKKNHEDLEKKQLQVDRLNKQFGHLTKSKGNEDEGLYEVKIKELQSEIDNLKSAITTSEENWIKKKTSLVEKVNQMNGINDNARDMRNKKKILSHKKLRLESTLKMNEKETRDVEISLKNLRYDMNKYNGMLSKNVNSKDKLSLKFFDVEIEFKEKLKQMENVSTKYELEIESLREEKTDILAQILEVERQIHLWERKIKLQNKMQEIIKPESGRKEIDDIKYTIHRQDILYKKLKQEQEQVIKNIEMEVARRDYIKLKFPSKTSGVKAEKNPDREINNLKDDLNHLMKEYKKIERQYFEKEKEWESMQEDIESSGLLTKNIIKQQTELESSKLISLIKQYVFSSNAIKSQKETKILEGYLNQPRNYNKENLMEKYNIERNKNNIIIDLLINAKDILDDKEISDIIDIVSQI